MTEQQAAMRQMIEVLEENHHLIEEHERPEYLAHYDRVISAGRRALEQQPADYPLRDDLYDSKDWRAGSYAERVEWLHSMYEAKKRELDAFLEQQPAGEPVAWMPIETAPRYGRILVSGTEIGVCVASAGWDNETPEQIRWEVVNGIVVAPTHWMPIPTRPQPAAQWVGLTVEEIEHEWDEFMSGKSDGYVPTFVRAIEAKLREKNGGKA